jgi:hypothetical protein
VSSSTYFAKTAGDASVIPTGLEYGEERIYGAMARAFASQAVDYVGMADALEPWRDDSAPDTRSRLYTTLWRLLLVEGLLGSGQSVLAPPSS